VVNWRGLLYYNHKEEATGRWASVYLMCNPIVCWLCGACVAVAIAVVLVFCRYRDLPALRGHLGASRKRTLHTCVFLLAGWLCNLLPYILVDRSAFVYHYLPGLLYAQLLTGAMVDQLPRRARFVTMALIFSAIISAFVYFSPWTYCFPLSSEEHAQMRWFGRWD
jgi:dolichyl-phosphate-mannose-protein mannosyltransferase